MVLRHNFTFHKLVLFNNKIENKFDLRVLDLGWNRIENKCTTYVADTLRINFTLHFFSLADNIIEK